MGTATTDVAIVGGGVMGSAIATFLRGDPAFDGRVVVIERDPTYQRASSALSASSIRQQFSTPANIAMSSFGFDFLRDVGRHLAVDGEAAPAHRPDRTRLPLPRDVGRRDRHARGPRGTARPGCAGRPPLARRPRGSIPVALDRWGRPRIARARARGLVRRLRPDAGVPPQGRVARGRVSRQRGGRRSPWTMAG